MVGEDFCSRLHLLGVLHVIYTDISRDGTMGGVNVELYERLTKKCALDIIASRRRWQPGGYKKAA